MPRRKTAKMGRPAKYVKPLSRTYRVSKKHVKRVADLRHELGCRSNSDVIEEAVRRLHLTITVGLLDETTTS